MAHGAEPPLRERMRTLPSRQPRSRFGLEERRLPIWLVPVAAASIIVLALTWLWPMESAKPIYSPWNSQPMFGKVEPNSAALPTPGALSGATQAVDQFDIQLDDGLYPGQNAALAQDLQRALAYVTTRFGSGANARFTAAVVRDDQCALHGIAFTDVRTVQVFTCNDLARSRAVAIMAHEFVHQLEQDRYGPPHLHADTILSEGMATWAAGSYWLGKQPDFRAYVRAQRQAGTFYPLATDYSGLGVNAMNALYYEWASFIDFLIQTYGRPALDQVYVTGQSNPGTANYQLAYGKDLSTLEREWIAWLDR